MNEDKIDINTICALTYAHELLVQGETIRGIYEYMEETWLSLYTKDKKCPIIEQMGTTVKRSLVQRYAIVLIREIRNTIGLNLITKTIDDDGDFWVADDVVIRVADNKTESHEQLFKLLLGSIFGLSTKVMEFMFLETKTKADLYKLISGHYDIKIIDWEEDDIIDIAYMDKVLSEYLLTGEPTLFKVNVF